MTPITETSILPPVTGARFRCPRCGGALAVEFLPASGPCPVCRETIHLAVAGQGATRRRMPFSVWLLVLVSILALTIALLLLGDRIRMSGLNVWSYNPSSDNRFRAWPWSLRVNPHCRVPSAALTGIGWDEWGRPHALVNPSFIVTTHNSPRGPIRFKDISGRILIRSVVSSHTLRTDEYGNAWIRLCKLDRELPPDVRPLPILDLSGHLTFDAPMFLIGRHGRIGSEQPVSVSIMTSTRQSREYLRSWGLLRASQERAGRGSASLRHGDSGTPLIARVDAEWVLVGLANAVDGSREAGQVTTHIHALLCPQIPEMRLAGANPGILELERPRENPVTVLR